MLSILYVQQTIQWRLVVFFFYAYATMHGQKHIKFTFTNLTNIVQENNKFGIQNKISPLSLKILVHLLL